VTFSSLINGELDTVSTDSTGLAQSKALPFYGSDTITAKAFVKIVGQTVEKSWTVSVSGGQQPATPVPAAPATPVPAAPATPVATVAKSTPAPQATTVINIYVPPTTVINNVIPGTVTQGTNNKWGCPEVTVKNPGPDKLRTTILDFAKNPEDNTAHYNEQVGIAKADGWTLTDHGEKTFGDASKDYRYSRFTKGTSTLLLAAQGNNSTEKNYDIPGDLLITEKDEAVSSSNSLGSLLGVPGFEAVYAVAGLVAVAYLVMRRRK
jgi:PGF-CTERM protein